VQDALRGDAHRGGAFVEVVALHAVGHGATETPRGLLYHRYEIDEDGTILDAWIVPPTSQNQLAIEQDPCAVVERYLDLPDEQLSLRCEQAIRNHDPCISCATHFLELTVDRGQESCGAHAVAAGDGDRRGKRVSPRRRGEPGGRARARARAGAAGVAVREQEGETLTLLDDWEGSDAVVLVATIRPGMASGTIHRADASSQPIPAALRGLPARLACRRGARRGGHLAR
jgi:hypothetical protein